MNCYDNPPDEDNDYEPELVDKILLMLMPAITPERLKYCGFWPSAHNIPGVYSSAPAFCTTIVATNQLPQNESTLLLRLLKLDASHPHRNTAIAQLQQWHQLLSTGQMGKESQRLMASFATTYS